MAAACGLIQGLGAKVCGCAFFVELAFLTGRKALSAYEPIVSLIRYDKE
jgi:adenine phosphoribosyltransferase